MEGCFTLQWGGVQMVGFTFKWVVRPMGGISFDGGGIKKNCRMGDPPVPHYGKPCKDLPETAKVIAIDIWLWGDCLPSLSKNDCLKLSHQVFLYLLWVKLSLDA